MRDGAPRTSRRAVTPATGTRSRTPTGPLALFTVAIATAACGGAPPDPAADAAPLPTLRESRTLGCEDCTGPEALSVMDLGLRDDGAVVVLNQFEPFVRIFDPTGELTLTVGTEGEGPGEMVAPGLLYLNDDGSFRVLDAGRMQLAGYAPEGEPLEAVRFPVGLGLVPTDTAYDAGSRTLWILGFRVGEASMPTVATIPLDGAEPAIRWTSAELPDVEEGEEPRPAEFAIALGPDATVALGNGRDYRIAIRDSGGNVIHELGRDLPLPRKSEEQLEQERQRSRTGEEPDPEAPHFQSKAMEFDDRGRLWVKTAHAGPGSTSLDLFDPVDGYLGTLELQEELFDRIPAFELRGGRLAAVIVSESGNTRVRIWEVVETTERTP